jgi:hypothetical protein
MTPVRATATYLVAITAFSASRGDRRVIAYLLVLGAIGGALWLTHRVAPLGPRLQWALAGCGLLHVAGGLLPSPDAGAPVLYETWIVPQVLKYDQAVHFAVSAVVTVVAWHALQAWLDPDRRPVVACAVLALLIANGFGALNEAFEFVSALRFADAFVGGLDNAGWDIVFNGFGSATAAVLLLAGSRPYAGEDAETRSPDACASQVANISA